MAELDTAGREGVVAWLQANGINPDDVPLTSTFTECVNGDGDRVIRYRALLREYGRLCMAEDGSGPVVEDRETPCLQPWSVTGPDQWTAEHRLTLLAQTESSAGTIDHRGQRWLDRRSTGLVLAACNCGYTTGWIPRAELPSYEWLLGKHGLAT